MTAPKGRPFSTDLPCPACAQPAGRWCVDERGRPRVNAHRERIEAARLQREGRAP